MADDRYEVVVTDSNFPDVTEEQEALGKVGARVRKLPAPTEEAIIGGARDADLILCDLAPINRRVISNLRKTCGVVVYGVGYDNVDVEAATEKGIVVCNIPDFMTSEVAEHTLALILALTRRITWADRLTKTGGWSTYGPLTWQKLMPLARLDGKVAGIVGLGRIGRQVAERLRGFGVRVLAYDPYTAIDAAARAGAELTDLRTLLRESDIISVNALLSKETFHLIGEEEVRLMKKTAIFVNTARGKVVDQKCIMAALASSEIAGAALDVLENEPPNADDPVLRLDNVIVTPHIAGVSEESIRNVRRLAIEEAERLLTGRPPRKPVNPAVLAKKFGRR